MHFPLRPAAFGPLGKTTLLVLTLIGSGAAMAQDPPKPVYRCPGPPVLYTDALSSAEAREKGCRVIEGAAITVVPAPRARSNGAAASSTARPGEAKVDPAAQRARDSDARRILADELKSEEERLAALQKEYNNGEPEKQGAEFRNHQKYLDRVAELKASIARTENDITGLKRELGRAGSK